MALIGCVAGELTADAAEYTWEQTFERIRTSSPELAAAAAEIERSRWVLQRACVEPTPNVTVQAGAAYDYATLDSIALLQVSLPIPIHDRNQGAIAEARANVVAAERSVQRVELSLQERLAVVLQQYEQALQQATRYEDIILPKAKRNLDLNQSTFEAGETAYLAVLTAQRSYSQARLAWLHALEQLWSATVQVEGLLRQESQFVGGSGQGQSRRFKSFLFFRIVFSKCGRRQRSNPTEQVLSWRWERSP